MPSLFKVLCVITSFLSVFTGQVCADAVGDLQTKARTAINAQLAKSTTCTQAKLQVRKEWYVLPTTLRVLLIEQGRCGCC
jgi:tyrosinase